MPETDHLLHDIDRRLERIEERFLEIITAPTFELDDAMTLLTDIQGARADVQAVTAALPADVATAVAAQKATDDAANQANITELADAQTEVTGLLSDIAALKTAAGIQPTTPVGSTVAITSANPLSVTGGSSVTGAVALTGGTGALTITAATSADGAISMDSSGNLSGTAGASGGSTTIAVDGTDSASPPVPFSLVQTVNYS